MQDRKETADVTVKDAAAPGHQVDTTLIWQRYAGKYSSPQPRVGGRDVTVYEALNRYRGVRIEPGEMSSEAPLFLMTTSGEDTGDVSTLAHPEVVAELRKIAERSNAQGRDSRQRADGERRGVRVREEDGGALSFLRTFLRTASAPGWVLSRLGLNWSP